MKHPTFHFLLFTLLLASCALPDETTRSTRSITITELTTRLIPN